jgi:hypothetical protein
MMTKHEPDSTRLINIPVTLDDKKYKLLIYTNDMKISNKDQPALMIVPFPNPSNADNFGLVNVTTDKMKAFRKKLFEECERLKPIEQDDGILYLSAEPSYTLKPIHNIGNYNISVANNLQELEKNIDWNKFSKPDNFDMRYTTFRNKTIYPESNYCYVVAEARVSVKNDGFGFVYPDCGHDYFPTAHEIESDILDDVDYDVKLYNFSEKKGPYVLFNKYFLRCYNIQKETTEHSDILKLLDNNMIMSKDGSERIFETYLHYHNINFFELHEKQPNNNLRLGLRNPDFKIQSTLYRQKDYEFNPYVEKIVSGM